MASRARIRAINRNFASKNNDQKRRDYEYLLDTFLDNGNNYKVNGENYLQQPNLIQKKVRSREAGTSYSEIYGANRDRRGRNMYNKIVPLSVGENQLREMRRVNERSNYKFDLYIAPEEITSVIEQNHRYVRVRSQRYGVKQRINDAVWTGYEGAPYIVKLEEVQNGVVNPIACTCPDFLLRDEEQDERRLRERRECKHMRLVGFALRRRGSSRRRRRNRRGR